MPEKSPLRGLFGKYNRARFLARLNAPDITGARAHMRKSDNLLRIVDLAGQLNEMDLAKAAKEPPLHNRFRIGDQEITTFASTLLEELESELNSRARAAKLSILLTPTFTIKNGKLRCVLLPTTDASGEGVSAPDMRILADLQEAIATGDLERLQRCKHCKRWFFKIRKRHMFCSRKCFRICNQQGEPYKAKRRPYMREYRRNDKRKAVEALAKARRAK